MLNYYEVLGLPCEPPKCHEIERIQAALTAWKFKTENAFNTATDYEKQQLNEQLKAKADMQRLLTDQALRTQHAEELLKRRREQLKSVIAIITECSGNTHKEILDARLQKISNELSLMLGTVKKSFQDAGYTVVMKPAVDVNDILLNETHWNKLMGHFAELKNYMKENPNDPLAAMMEIKDIYDYIALMDSGSLANVEQYRSMATETLCSVFEMKKKEHVTNTMPKRVYKQIELHVCAQILHDNGQREKYNNYLKTAALQSFFDTLDIVPVSLKQEHQFAQGCIKRIQKTLPISREYAVAVYNSLGHLPKGAPYEDESTVVSTVCSVCGAVNEHDSLEQAQKALCSCGAPLYRACPACGKLVPAIAEYCACGFFIKGMGAFENHYIQFQDALKAMNLEKAKTAYANARLSNPAENRLNAMRNAVEKLEADLGKPMQEIESLISAGRINAAIRKIQQLKAQRPGVNLQQYEKQTSNVLNWAQSEYIKCRNCTNESQGIEVCMGIITRITDFEPAIEWLRSHRPHPVVNVRAVKDSNNLTCTLQWDANPNNRYVNYSIVRKEGAKPQNIQDGDLLSANQKEMVYRDNTVKPGKLYVYAVFTTRGDSVSQPAYLNELVCLFKDITSVQANVSNQTCTLTWADIPGSKGVKILRSADSGAQWNIVSECSKGAFCDRGIKNGSQYRYRLQTVWEVGGKVYCSNGIVRDVKVEEKPSPVDITLESTSNDGICEIVWTPTSGLGTVRLVALNETANIVKGRTYTQDQLPNYGTVFAPAVPIGNGRYTWKVGSGKRVRVAVFRPYGDDAVAGNTLFISTVPSVTVDMKKSVIAGDTLQLVVKDIPAGVTRLYYWVAADSGAKSELYATEDMAAQSKIPSIDMTTYKRENVIVVGKLPQQELYVSVIAMYGNGEQRYFSPTAKAQFSNMPKKKVEYWIEWEVAGLAWKRHTVRKGAKLCVRAEGTRIPATVLCCRRDGRMLFQYLEGSPDIVELKRVSAEEVDSGEVRKYPLDESRMNGIPKDTDIQLFLVENETMRYLQPIATDVASRKMPQAD